jgi:PAS domain S-box-containing protein
MIVSKLFKKTLFIIIILFLVIALTIAISSGWNMYKNLNAEYTSKGSAIAKSIAGSSVETLLNRDASTIQALIDQFLEIIGVSYVFVVDARGEIISHTFVPRIPNEILEIKDLETRVTTSRDIEILQRGSYIDIASPILEGTVGYVHVGMDKGMIRAQMESAMIRQLILLLIIFLFSVGAAYIFVNKISQPLTKLTEYSKKLASHDFSSAVDITSKDEIGLLADTMKSMATDLHEVFDRYEQALNDAIVELQDTLTYLTAIIDNMADGLLVTDTDGLVTRVNPALSEMFNIKDTDIIGKICDDHFSPELALLVQQTREKSGEIFTSEINLSEGRTGKAVATGIHADMLQSGQSEGKGIGAVVLIRDITTEKEIDRMKTDFISTVSHELRTPLTSVRGFTEIIKKKLEEDIFPRLGDASFDSRIQKTLRRIRENIEIILSEGERLTTLINDVLDISKLEAGRVEWKFEQINIADIIERAWISMSSLFVQKKLKFQKFIDENLPEVMGDQDRLLQVVINILSNAVKFTEHGTITCKVYQHDNEIVVSITDTGIGIASSEKKYLFEKFRQATDTINYRPGGTGLGLSICKQIIDQHEGKIWVDSKVGKGSTFTFTLPISSDGTVKFASETTYLAKQ